MKHFVGLVAVLVLLCLESDAGPQPKLIQTPCDKSRKVYTEPWGIITDGPVGSNYTQDSHCEWLIKGKLNSICHILYLGCISVSY